MTGFLKNIANHPKNKVFLRSAIAIFLIGVLGNLIFTLSTTDRSLLISISTFRPQYLLLAVILGLVPWLTNTLRLMIWTRFLGKRFSARNLFQIVLSTELGSALSPTAIGGGYVKAGMLIQKGLSAGAAASLMTLGSVEDGIFFLMVLPLALFLSSSWEMPLIRSFLHEVVRFLSQYSTMILIFAAILLLLFLWKKIFPIRRATKPANPNRFFNKIGHIKNDFTAVYKLVAKNGKTRLMLSLLLTSAQWLCRYSVITALLMSFEIPVNPVLLFVLQWVTFTMMTFIPTPGATVGAETSFYFVYSTLIPKDILGLLTAGWRFLTFYLQIGLGVMILGLFQVLQSARRSVC